MKATVPPPELDVFWRNYKPDAFLKLLRSGSGLASDVVAQYLSWPDVHQQQTVNDLTAEQRWFLAKLVRRQSYRPLPFSDARGRPFQIGLPSSAMEMLHFIDRQVPGSNPAFELISSHQTEPTYRLKSLVEESIRSGQLDGGLTPRRAAKEMLLAGKEPGDPAQRQIFNQFAALEQVRVWRSEPLTVDRVLELQAKLTGGLSEDPSGGGQLRRSDDRVTPGESPGRLSHRLPVAAELPARLQALCAFANEKGAEFMHPVVRAALVAFALTHDTPFVDGNGRTARALFYWVMAREGYPLAEYVSISRVFRKARAQYLRAFQDTMSDDNDATYFVLYFLNIYARAIRELNEYLDRKRGEVQDVEARLSRSRLRNADLNKRQLDVLANALKDATAVYTIEAHRRGHDTAYATARADLLKLAEVGLLEHRKRERSFIFVPVGDLLDKLPADPAGAPEAPRASTLETPTASPIVSPIVSPNA